MMALNIDSRPSKKRRVSPPSVKVPHDELSDETEEITSQTRSVGNEYTYGDGVDSGLGIAQIKANGSSDVKGERAMTNGAEREAQSRPLRSKQGHETPSRTDAFSLQVHELLRQTQPKYSSIDPLVKGLLARIKAAINGVSPMGPLSLSQADEDISKSRVAIPFPEPRPSTNVNYKFTFSAPIKVVLVGSFSQKTAIQPDERLSIEVAVQMPDSIFTEKDYLNFRYFHKRAFYLAKLSAAIKDHMKNEVDLSFEHSEGNPLLPILLVRLKPNDTESSLSQLRWAICIKPYVQKEIFPSPKTLPDRNCVRPQTRQESKDENLFPTPFYNASLCKDTATRQLQELTDEAARTCSAYRGACILGRVWLRQRGFDSPVNRGGFGLSEWSTLVAMLLSGGGARAQPALLPTFNIHQLFKATLQWLSLRHLSDQPLVLGSSQYSPKSSVNGPILFSAAMNLNILFKMTISSYESLRREAQASMRVLNKNANDAFESSFIIKVDEPLLKYDYITTFILPSSTLEDVNIKGEPWAFEQSKRIYDVFHRGLSDRVTTVEVRSPESTLWNIHAPSPSKPSKTLFRVGLTINPNVALRKVDRGPAVEDEEKVAEFRMFWGSKCEQRRFKDGSVLETVSWSQTNARHLVQEIIAYLVNANFSSVDTESVTVKGNECEAILPKSSMSLTAFDRVKIAYDDLDRDIRSLNELPLKIKQIRPASSVLNAVSRNIPRSPASGSNGSIDVIVQFESSSRWPSDLAAIQMTKVAFLLKMAELLSGNSSKPTTRLGLENEDSTVLNKCFLDIEYSKGFTFRVRVHHEREQALIEGQLKSNLVSAKDRETTTSAMSLYKRSFERRPAHVGAIKILAQRYLALSPATRLLKAWFGAHLLSSHFAEELIDLIVARTFTFPFPWSTPNTAMTAFLRSLLFLSWWDWQHDPLIVDFSGDMTLEDIGGIETRFQAWRKIDPALNRVTIFAATNFDHDGTTWTEYRPSKVIAGRMTSLAKAAVKAILQDGVSLQLDRLFKTSLKDYDFIVELNPRYINEAKESNLNEMDQGGLGSTTGHSANSSIVSYFEELTSIYAETALFFFDANGGSVITGIWNPSTNSRPWKASIPYSTQPKTSSHEEQISATLNRSAILAEMTRLGGDLVTTVTPR